MKIPEWIVVDLCSRPEIKGNNTKFLFAFYEYICSSRSLPTTWENIKAIGLEYPPESVTRARRKYVQSTTNQLHNQTQYAR